MRTGFLKTHLLPAIAVVLSAGLVQAETSGGKSADKHHEKLASKPLEKVTCEEFNGFEDTFKPKVVAWAAGYKQGQKKPDAVAIDIAGVEKVTPLIAEECRKAPAASLWSKIDGELKKVF
ncbi:acid-activated periplasmic chaperone HdeA [Methylorubrum thiocyanatum]|uniref:Probable acid stress chaperone HdeA n=1 Tax=Methylorubrum thiocyanatum TaxID=47958 RepID=A0AA40RZQ0_9HYPH|nr:acid-activated periplasmic chaperone HdeA [Methylorubrum thiocyanatum]MBA8911949.1 acid stress chaperone HdeA [Methylorubrum thiocyanatum]GJE79757.1 Acid stress chaperone HdeA [Methylorubrum thiocyanatum]